MEGNQRKYTSRNKYSNFPCFKEEFILFTIVIGLDKTLDFIEKGGADSDFK